MQRAKGKRRPLQFLTAAFLVAGVLGPVEASAGANYNLLIFRSGGGEATISDQFGFICDTTVVSPCQKTYVQGTEVTLAAEPTELSRFIEWTECDSVNDLQCTITMEADDNVTIVIAAGRRLTVGKAGGGEGTVVSDPAGIDCGTGCASQVESFFHDSEITLTATPASGSGFETWLGCEGVPTPTTCEVTLDTAHAVFAVFEVLPVDKVLSVTAAPGKVRKGKRSVLTATISPCVHATQNDTVALAGTLLPVDLACVATTTVKPRVATSYTAVSPADEDSGAASDDVTVKIKRRKKRN